MEHTSAFTSIIDSQLLPMRVGIVFLMGCCILAAYCTNKRKNIEKKEYLRIHAQNHYIINGASLLVAYENVGGKIDI